MRQLRMLLLAAAVLFVTACSGASANSAGVWVKVSPTTITAGYQTDITASCGENANAATVSSPAFGSVTMQPVAGVLSARVTVPHTTAKGTYDVYLRCPTGSQATTTLTVLGTSAGPPPGVPGPNTGGGFLAGRHGGLDRTTYMWLGAGVVSLLAATAIAHRKGLIRLPGRRRAGRSVRGHDRS